MAEGARGIRAGRAFVELGVSDKVTAGLKRAQRQLNAFGAAVRSAGLRLAALGTAALAPLGLAVRRFSSAGDAIDKMSARTGFSAEALSELGFAAEQSGADIETLETGIRVLQRSINDAERGLSTATDGLSDLGLSAQQLRALNPEQQFELLAERLSRIEDPSKRAALAMQLLGRSGTRLLPLFADGAAGMRALREQARAFGLTISGDAARQAAILTDTLNLLRRALLGAAFHIGAALAPLLTDLAERAARVAAAVGRWIAQNRGLIVTVATVAAGVTAAGFSLVGLGVAIQGVAFALGGLAKALVIGKAVLAGATAVLSAMLSPIGLVVSAIAGLGIAIALHSGAAGEALSWLGEQWRRLADFVGEVVGGIADALAAGDIALAAKVLWAGLRVVWETGTAKLRQVWESIWLPIQKAAIEAFAGVQQAWIIVRDWFERSFPDFTAGVAKAWANLTSGLRSVWASFQGWLTDRWLELMGLFDETIDVGAAQALNRADVEDQLAGIERDRQAAIDEAERRRQRSDAQREAEKQAALAESERAAQEALALAQSESDERVQAAQDALEAAREELKAARQMARERRSTAEAGAPSARRFEFDPDSIGEAVTQAARRVEVAGTFSASAVAGLAADPNSVRQQLNDLLKEMQKNRQAVERLERREG